MRKGALFGFLAIALSWQSFAGNNTAKSENQIPQKAETHIQQNIQQDTQQQLPLKFQLPPQEIALIEQKKQLELQALRYRLLQKNLQIQKLEKNLIMEKIKSEADIKKLKKLYQLELEKLKQLAIANIEVLGRVGQVIITPNLAIKNGQKVAQDTYLEIKNKSIVIRDKKTGRELIVATYTKNTKLFAQNIEGDINALERKQTTLYRLKSGEKFRGRIR